MAQELRILITDEDPDSRVAARRAVERAQMAVAGEVGYGTAAVSLALNARPDIILVAVEEPIGRPLETAEALANSLPDTPIIIYSSVNDPEAIRRGMVFGARDYIVKPVEAQRLREGIETVLAQEERRHLRRSGQIDAAAGRGSVVTVTGAKGGIGKTIVSVNIALALRMETGKSVAVLDADTQFGDVATMLDLAPRHTLGDLVRMVDRVNRQSLPEYATEHASGVAVYATPADDDTWERVDRQSIKRIIDLLAEMYDFVIIDTSGTFDAVVHACVEESTLTLLVTSGEVSSVRDTAAAIRRLDNWEVDPVRVKLVLNRGARVGNIKPQDIKAAVGRDVFWQIPFDRAVPVSIQMGQPVMLSGNSAAARNLIALARLIAGTRRSLVTKPQHGGLLQRLFRRKGPEHDSTMAAGPSVPAREQ